MTEVRSKSEFIRNLTYCSMFSALICACSMISFNVPITPVPITLQTFAVLITGCVLGKKFGLLSVVVYLLLGIVGLPVFSGFKSGIFTFFGPTGGFLWGFLPAVFVTGLLSEFFKKRYPWRNSLLTALLPSVMGMLIIHACGLLHITVVNKIDISSSFAIATLPFIGVDLIKIFLVYSAYASLRKNNII